VLKPITKASLYDEAARQLQAGIEAGTWPPGTRLPSERELAQMLGIGRSSVREAMRMLEAIDLVDIRPGEGTFVRRERHPLADAGVRALLREEHVAEAYEVRELLETQVVALAVERATLDDLGAMESALDRMAATIKTGGTGLEEDRDFHTALTRVVDNQLLLQIHGMLWERLRPAIEQSFQVPGRAERALAEHRAIFEAIKGRDASAAREQTLKHLHSRFTDPAVPAALKSKRNHEGQREAQRHGS